MEFVILGKIVRDQSLKLSSVGPVDAPHSLAHSRRDEVVLWTERAKADRYPKKAPEHSFRFRHTLLVRDAPEPGKARIHASRDHRSGLRVSPLYRLHVEAVLCHFGE